VARGRRIHAFDVRRRGIGSIASKTNSSLGRRAHRTLRSLPLAAAARKWRCLMRWRSRASKTGRRDAALERLQPSAVVTLNRAVAVAKLRGPAEALAMIEPLAVQLAEYYYYHGAKGAFLAELGRASAARAAFNQAIALAHSPAEAAIVRQHIDRLAQGAPHAARKPCSATNLGH